MGRTRRRVVTVGSGVLVGVFGFAAGASAHVEISPDQAVPGSVSRVALRVPDESDTASTTKVQVYLPTDHPLATVLVQPVPGWTATVSTTHLSSPVTTDDGGKVSDAVSQVTWTADSATTAIKPGQFQEFPLTIGPLPKVDSMTFKALQTYSDGSVVRWIDLSTPGQAEPEHPAPVLKLTAGTTGTTAGSAASAAPSVAVAASSGSGSGSALAVGITGLVLGLIGAVLGGLALVRTRRAAG